MYIAITTCNNYSHKWLLLWQQQLHYIITSVVYSRLFMLLEERSIATRSEEINQYHLGEEVATGKSEGGGGTDPAL